MNFSNLVFSSNIIPYAFNSQPKTFPHRALKYAKIFAPKTLKTPLSHDPVVSSTLLTQ
jgi:hypothetical protein